jgi:hypothetical protein
MPRSQGCEVRAFLSSLDTGEWRKFLLHLFYELHGGHSVNCLEGVGRRIGPMNSSEIT